LWRGDAAAQAFASAGIKGGDLDLRAAQVYT
jgi:hypothetical protein